MNLWTLTLILLGWLAVIIVAGLILLALTSIAVGFRSAWRKKDQPSNTVQIIARSNVDAAQVAEQVMRSGRQS